MISVCSKSTHAGTCSRMTLFTDKGKSQVCHLGYKWSEEYRSEFCSSGILCAIILFYFILLGTMINIHNLLFKHIALEFGGQHRRIGVAFSCSELTY